MIKVRYAFYWLILGILAYSLLGAKFETFGDMLAAAAFFIAAVCCDLEE